MRLLADESCDFRVVQAIRNAGHDVLAIVETAPGSTDQQVLELARHQRRPLLTEDRDFGQLVFAADFESSAGVLFIRCPERARPGLGDHIVALVKRLGPDLDRSFVVWSPTRARIRRFGASDT